jgi:hypothetical protein
MMPRSLASTYAQAPKVKILPRVAYAQAPEVKILPCVVCVGSPKGENPALRCLYAASPKGENPALRCLCYKPQN